MSARHALYPGTFDPVTFGHLDILERALRLFDRVTVAVAARSKAGLFSLEDRVDLLGKVTAGWQGCRVEPFGGLLVDEVGRQGCDVVVRGIRSFADFEHEMPMVGVNRILLPGIEYVFLPARPDLAPVSSSLVRQVASGGGNLDRLVPPEVVRALGDRLAGGAP